MDIDSLDLDRVMIEWHADQIDVTTTVPQRNPNWRHVDSHGHEHRYGVDFSVPTLTWVETYTPEVPGGVYVDAGGDEWNDEPEGYYECSQCGERVSPGWLIDPVRRYIDGNVTAKVNGELVTAEEFDRLRVRFASR